MPVEGMVDALFRARHLLKPNGCLVDVHPTVEPAHVEVGSSSDAVLRIGPVRGEHALRRHGQADAAVAEIIGRGVFSLHASREFSFRTYGDSIEELAEYIARTSTSGSHIDDVTQERARDVLRARPTHAVWVREQVRMTKLRPEPDSV